MSKFHVFIFGHQDHYSGIKVQISKKSGNQGLLLKNCMKIKELRVLEWCFGLGGGVWSCFRLGGCVWGVLGSHRWRRHNPEICDASRNVEKCWVLLKSLTGGTSLVTVYALFWSNNALFWFSYFTFLCIDFSALIVCTVVDCFYCCTYALFCSIARCTVLIFILTFSDKQKARPQALF